MILKLAFLKNQKQILIRTFNLVENTSSQKLVNIDSIEKETIHTILIEQEALTESEFKAEILENTKYFPVRDAQDLKISFDQFEKLSVKEASVLFGRINQTFTLQNNVSLLENMHSIVAHMNKLFPNDRTSFFEELWFLTKKNLGALDLKIIYNDIKPNEKNEVKNSLIQVIVEGNRVPNPKEGGAFEKGLMENYSDEFIQEFNIVEFDAEKGQMVIAGNIKKSPYLMMVSTHEVSRLSQAVVKNLLFSFGY